MLPRWAELTEKISEFERKVDNAINQKVQGIQSEHSLIHRTVKVTINSIFPSPFNEIVKTIYDDSASAGSSEQEAIPKVKLYFKVLQDNGEENYDKIFSHLNSIDSVLFNSRTISAKENTVQLLKEILVSKQDVLEKIENLKSHLDKTHIELGNITGDAIGVGVTGDGNIIFKASSVFINEVKQHYGLRLIESNYFAENKRTEGNFQDWLNGSEFKLPSIYYGLEYRRDRILDEIRKKLESKYMLLLLGESGSSKTTLLMEVLCHYFDMNYKILYSDGTQSFSNVDGILDTVKGLANADNKVLVVVDNVHGNKMAMIFYIIDQLQSFNNVEKIRFLLAARQPEYNALLTTRILSEDVRIYKDSILSFKKESRYEIPYFTLDEVTGFMKKFPGRKNIDEVLKIFDETKGHPIMVKFSILGEGLDKDVENRFGRYLTMRDGTGEPDHNKIITTMICSLFHIATLNITSESLETLKFDSEKNCLTYANDLYKSILYEENDAWKTLHVRWALELLSFVFDHYKDNRNIYSKIENDFQESLIKIYDNFEATIVLRILDTIYNTIAVGKYVSIESLDKTVPIPVSFTNKMKCNASYNRSRALISLGKHVEAIQCLDMILEIDDRYVVAWNAKGYIFDELDRYDEAIRYYDKAIAIEGNNIYAWSHKGHTLITLRRYDEAIYCLDRAHTAGSKDARDFYNKGVALYHLGRNNEAINNFDNALKIDEKLLDAWYNKGVVLGNLGRYKEEIECYDRVLEIDDKYARAWNNKGVALDGLRKYDEGITCYDKALKIDNKNVDALINKGYAFRKLSRYEESTKCFEKALEIDDKNVDAWNNKGLLFNGLGKYGEAMECFEKALEIDDKNVDAWNNEGNVYYNLYGYEKAIEYYDRVLEIDDKHLHSWCDKGLALNKLGKNIEAIKCFDRALEIDERNARVWTSKGIILGKLCKYDDAIVCYDKALKFDENYIDALNNKGILLGGLRMYAEAIECFDRALVIDDKCAIAWQMKGLIPCVQGNYEEAIECFDRALEIDDKYADAWNSKGLVLDTLGKHKDAKKCYEKANQLG